MYKYKAVVTYVVDGDTVDVEIDLGFKIKVAQRLRLARVDTPEKGQPGYLEAKEYVRDCIEGEDVTIITHKVSKWGYYLADVVIEGYNVSDMLLAAGLGLPYDGGKK